jgi:hypothetical protein
MRIPASVGLVLLCLLQLLCLWRAPAVFSPSAIEITLKPGQSQTVGRIELAAPQAAASHLALRRDGSGAWWLRNVSAGKQLLLARAGVDQRMGTAQLRQGQQLRIGAAAFTVVAADARAAAFTGPGGSWRYDGATLLRDGSAQAPCPGTSAARRAGALFNRAAPHRLTMASPLSFGGNLYCGNRLPIPRLATGSATLSRAAGALILSSSDASAPLLVDGSDLARTEQKLAGVDTLVAGRTRMAVQIDGARLTLRPLRHVALYTAQDVTLPQGVAWRWQQRAVWSLPSGLAWWIMLALLAAGAAASALAWQSGRWPFGRGDGHAPRGGCCWPWPACWPSSTLLLAAGRPALATWAWAPPDAARTRPWLRHFQKTTACWQSAPAPRQLLAAAPRRRYVRCRRPGVNGCCGAGRPGAAGTGAAGAVWRRDRRLRPAAGRIRQAGADRAERALPGHRPWAAAGMAQVAPRCAGCAWARRHCCSLPCWRWRWCRSTIFRR